MSQMRCEVCVHLAGQRTLQDRCHFRAVQVDYLRRCLNESPPTAQATTPRTRLFIPGQHKAP
ncbi:hypothetical protein BDR06DRAFT_950486 [Suillus hirtellus]|nr:hypothetical protein BDR06DRAFT_950486 [Suillus hirtellus]